MKDEWRVKVSNSLLSYLLPTVFKTKKKAVDRIKFLKENSPLSSGESMKAIQTRVIELES